MRGILKFGVSTILLYTYTIAYLSIFIRLLDYFQFFVILNKANRNTHVHIFYAMFSFLLCKNPGVEVLGHSVGVFLTL